MLKVICLQCDLFSLAKPYVYDLEDNEIPDDPILTLLDSPNPMQSRSQFLWDYMFWNMVGNSYCYVDSDVVTNDTNKLYFLEHSKMHWPNDFERQKDKLILSKKSKADLDTTIIKYRFDDGTMIDIPLSKIIFNTDLSNGVGNWYKGKSRIEALYKIISNSEMVLDAENINYDFAKKFLVAGKSDPDNTTQLPLTGPEKESIEEKMNGRKRVHAVKSMIEIKRFVENLKHLDLPAQYMSQYFLIGSMYNIPRDILEADVKGTTYENQEKATMRHVSYTLQPKGNDFLEALGKKFGYYGLRKKVIISWDHLPFMQVFEKDRALTQSTQITTLTNMLKLGIDLEEINQYLDTDFKKAKYEQPKPTTPTAPKAE